MARFPEIKPEQYTKAQQGVVDAIKSGPRGVVQGPFLPLLHAPELANAVQALGAFLRYEVSLSDANKEFAIMITGRFWQAQYEWYAHRRLGIAAGVDQSTTDQLARGERPTGLSEEQEVIYAFCTELHLDHQVSDATFARAEAKFGKQGALEIVGLSGYYTLMSMILNTTQVPLPEGAVPLAPIAGLKR